MRKKIFFIRRCALVPKKTVVHTHTNKYNGIFLKVSDICHHFSPGLSILVEKSAAGCTCTRIHMHTLALEGNPRPLNRHLSVTPASRTDRSITRDGARRYGSA